MESEKRAPEIMAALEKECTECGERHWCNHGTNGVGLYCPNHDAAALIAALQAENGALRTDLSRVEAELTALVEARDEGRVVVLQCKVGDTVYALDEKNSTVREMLISVARILEDGTIAFQAECKDEEEGCFCNSFCAVRFSDRNMVDRKVFLHRTEAEAALGGGGDG